MAWTAPRTWIDKERIDETIMNAHIRDNFRYLKGLDGVPTIESGLIIDNTDGDEYLLLPSLTTGERDALSPVNGMVIYNETTNALNIYQNGGWGLIGGVTDHGNLTGLTDPDHPATAVSVAKLDEASYDDVQDFINQFGDRTHITGMVISDNYDGTAAISSGTGWCKVSDDINAEGKFFNYAGANTPALTDLRINYIYLDYNGGSPQLAVDTDQGLIYDFDHIVLGCAFRHGAHLHILNSNYTGLGTAHNTRMRFYEEGGSERTSGLVTSSTGTRNLIITAGVIWTGLTRQTTLSFNTSVVTQGTADDTEAFMLHDADGNFTINDVDKHLHNTTDVTETDIVEFIDSGQLRLKDDIFISGEAYDLFDAWDEWYTVDSGTNWTHVEGVSQINNTQYNDITSGLSNLTANRYGVHWLYIDQEGAHLHMVYGVGDYTLANAQIAEVPSNLPPIASTFGILIAKIIVQKDQSTLAFTYPWITTFTSAAANVHGNLSGLGDDDHTIYTLADGTRAMSELRLTPKSSSSGPEGTMFYDSDDDSVYVATEA